MAFVANPLSLSIPPASFETWLRENGHLEVLDKCAVDPARSSRGILSYIRGFAVNPFANITFDDLCRPPVPWTGQFWDCGNGFFDSYGLPLSGTQLKLRMSENIKRYMGNYLRLFLIILACFMYKMPVTFGGLIVVVALWEGIRQLLNYFKLQRDSFFHQAFFIFGNAVTFVVVFYCKVAMLVCWAGFFSFAVMVLHSSLRKITPSRAASKGSIKMDNLFFKVKASENCELRCLNFFNCRLRCLSSDMPPTLVVEYAKSARAACKGCGSNMAKGSVRLGSITKAEGGFDMTRWYHPGCFMKQNKGKDTVNMDGISGFKSLKAVDQEDLKKQTSENDDIVAGAVSKRKQDSENDDIDAGTLSKRMKTETNQLERSEEAWKNALADFSASKMKSQYKDVQLPDGWKAFSTVILNEVEDMHAREKIAAFDFDGCLANTSLKRSGPDAWSLLYPSIPKKLEEFYADGYKLVIFTNESNIDRWKNARKKAVDSKIGRLQGFMKLINAPIQVFIACGKEGTDAFRKPNGGMWIFLEQLNKDVPIDKNRSFYVGDAAGRKGDHSDADLQFAKAVGLKFFLPEEMFDKESKDIAIEDKDSNSLPVEISDKESKDIDTEDKDSNSLPVEMSDKESKDIDTEDKDFNSLPVGISDKESKDIDTQDKNSNSLPVEIFDKESKDIDTVGK